MQVLCTDGEKAFWTITHLFSHIHTHPPPPGANIPGETRDAVLAAVRVREM